MGITKLVKNISVSIILSSLLASTSSASIGNFIRDQLNGSLEVTNAGYYKTQSGGFWTGGGLRVRWDMSGANINLFHAEAPHFAVGCNGVDMTFGSFSYLGFDKLVEKLKKISAAAPAMAFQMAIMTLCEQCNTIMTNLEKIADSLNNFNLNACQATKALAGKGASYITNLLSSSGVTQDASDTRPKVKTDTEWAITKSIETASNWFGNLGKEGMKNKLGYGSLINRISNIYKPGGGFSDGEFPAMMRAITGDVYGYAVKSTDSSGVTHMSISKYDIVPPAAVDGESFIRAIVFGGKIRAIVLNPNCDDKGICGPVDVKDLDFKTAQKTTGVLSTTDIEIKGDDSVFNYVNTQISNIINKLKAKESLTDKEINFINAMPLPVYKMVNIVSTLNLEQDSLKAVEEYLSYRILQSFVDSYFNEINKAVISLANNKDLAKTYDKDKLNKWREMAYKNIRAIKSLLNKRLTEAKKKVQIQEDLINRFSALEKEMYKRSPIWSANGL